MRRMGDGWHWQHDWAHLDEVPGTADAWAHHGLAVTSRGDVVGFRQLVVFAPDGHVLRCVETPLLEGHQITLVVVDGRECVWIADPGMCIHRASNGNLGHGLEIAGGPGRAALMTLDGEMVQEIPRPRLPPGAAHLPTSVAVDERARGGSGDIWVADGYGSGIVHRYDADGRLLAEIDGTDGAGRFDCPHAVFVDRRGDDPELYVADRGNARVQVFDLEGRFVRSFGEGVLTSPSSFASWGDTLVVAELDARLALFDARDELVAYVGDNRAVVAIRGWPNSLDHHGNVVRSRELAPERFNSPHAVAVGDDGSLFVAEWLVGGRYTKLTRRNSTT
jgi:hypothetical protein